MNTNDSSGLRDYRTGVFFDQLAGIRNRVTDQDSFVSLCVHSWLRSWSTKDVQIWVERLTLGPWPPVPALLAGVALLLATGCSSFNRDWKASGTMPQPAFGTPQSIAGRWQGTWRSDVNAHTDQLRCLITPSTNDTYAARFQAKYRKLIRLTFSYTVPLTVTNQEDGIHFEGAADLGWLAGGRYTYRGRATPTNFFSTYECRHDRGIFEMTRPVSVRYGAGSAQP